jgi:hypothetical protein
VFRALGADFSACHLKDFVTSGIPDVRGVRVHDIRALPGSRGDRSTQQFRGVARFFGIAKPMVGGEVTLVTGMEFSAKSND